MKRAGITSTSIVAGLAILILVGSLEAIVLPEGFESVQVLDSLESPAGMVFSPDGRLFISERIAGRLRVAVRDGDGWTLLAEPFYTFDIPADGNGDPQAHRSSGLRDLAFDPDWAENGYVYAFYMRDDPRHNRVVRLETDPLDPNKALDGSETLLFEMPFNATESSGSHNGGALEFGADGLLYVTTGDGWNGGDDVQSLATYTGKVFRLHRDGTIPTDNPFYGQAAGPLRAVYALGLRNPFSISREPTTGALFINDARGPDKADIYRVEPAANYGHDGYAGLGVETAPFAEGAVPGGRVITGGAWYPSGEGVSFPEAYHGNYFITLWGSNGGDAGDINRVLGVDEPVAEGFATDVRIGDAKPVLSRVDESTTDLFYMLTTYETGAGSVHRIRYTGTSCESAPGAPPIAHWRFDEGIGGLAADDIGAGAPDGLLVGPSWSLETTDGSPSSLDFDGVDDRVDLGSMASGYFDLGGGPFSVLFWFRADDFDQMDGRFLSKATGVQEADHLWMVSTLAVSGGHRLRFRLETGGVTSTLIADSGDLAAGVWHHAAATYDGQAMRLHLDGVPVGSLAKTGMVASDSAVGASIGDQPGGGRPFDGLIDDVRVYDRALDESELLALLTGQNPCGLFADGFETGDVGRWSSSLP